MLRRSNNRELWLAFAAIAGITLAYLAMLVWFQHVPSASGFFGHMLGILGFILMLMTETLYSIRKRRQTAGWGRMADWLDFHIFTGIVGPYMVLLHSSWKYNGLAGVVTLMTIIVVASGFVGRYIYTAVPRTADGVELEASALEAEIAKADQELGRWLRSPEHAASRRLVKELYPQSRMAGSELALVMGRAPSAWSFNRKWRFARIGANREARAQVKRLEQLIKRREQLRRQVASLAMARRLLALWHVVHVPIGLTLFAAAFIHILGAIYYASLLR